MRRRPRLVTLALALTTGLGLAGDRPAPDAPGPARGDVAVDLTPRPLDYEVYFPQGHQPGQVYPVVVGMFDTVFGHQDFLDRWRETYGSAHPFYYVVPRSGGVEVPVPSYSLSAAPDGEIPLTRAGMGSIRRALVEMVERMGRRHRISGAYLVTAQGMERLDVATLFSDQLILRF